jgi:hypothetical protein
MNDIKVTAFWNELIYNKLSSVEFVQDYIQLGFDGPTINVYNPITVKSDDVSITSWNNGFRDLLCGQINKVVGEIRFEPEHALKILFEDDSNIIVSLESDDYSSPEGIMANGFKDNNWLVQ